MNNANNTADTNSSYTVSSVWVTEAGLMTITGKELFSSREGAAKSALLGPKGVVELVASHMKGQIARGYVLSDLILVSKDGSVVEKLGTKVFKTREQAVNAAAVRAEKTGLTIAVEAI